MSWTSEEVRNVTLGHMDIGEPGCVDAGDLGHMDAGELGQVLARDPLLEPSLSLEHLW